MVLTTWRDRCVLAIRFSPTAKGSFTWNKTIVRSSGISLYSSVILVFHDCTRGWGKGFVSVLRSLPQAARYAISLVARTNYCQKQWLMNHKQIRPTPPILPFIDYGQMARIEL